MTIGIDLGDKKHAICALAGDGEVLEERTITNHRESLRRLSIKYPGSRVVMEVGTHSPWASRFLDELGHEVLVANPRKARAIYESDNKTDENDAATLARIGRFDPRMLHPVRHRGEGAQRDLLQIKLRDNIVRQRVDVISAVRFTLKSLGIRIPSPNTNCFAKRARLELAGEHAEILAMVGPSLEVIDVMTAKVKELDRRLACLAAERYPEAVRLQQIRGIGPITSLAYVLTIEDPERFERSRDVGAYLGMIPKRDQSGGVDKQLRITKAGDAYLRRLLVGAAQYMLGPFGEDCDLRRRGLALAERGGQGAKKKAVVAIARKLSVLMHVLWSSGSEYEPLRVGAGIEPGTTA